MLRLRVAGAAAAAVVVGVAVTVWVASPEPSVWADAVALTTVSLLFGLGMLPFVDAEPDPGAVAAVAALWGASSLTAAWLQVAQRAGVSPLQVGTGDVTAGVETGLPVVVGVVGALAVLGWAWWAGRDGVANPYVVAAIAAVGVLASSVTGHAGTSAWIPIAVGVHALAGAWWVGTLGALVATVRGRRGWATSLPAFSERALPVVGVLTAAGLLAAVGRIGLDADWWDTGYGRILLIKIAALALAVGVARWHRATWLAGARRHRIDEATSIRRAGVEIALLTLVLGLAAGLSVTG